MKCCLIFLFFSMGLMACKEKEMTLEELKKASWSKLDKGVEYISVKNNKTEPPDSIQFLVKGFLGTNITMSPTTLNEIQPILQTPLSQLIIDHLPQSKHGYLKIDFYKMMSPVFLTAMIYLRDDIDSLTLNNGINKLREIKGVTEVNYISKDMASKKYLDNGNEDWKKVLDSNPLPASIEIKFDKKLITPEDYERFKNKITDQMILYISDINISSDLLKKFEGNYYILEYTR